ncbi:hypothetical protein Peur_013795 [Populus x canadensis]
MAGIQQQQLVKDTLPASWNGSSNRIASVNVEGQPQPWVDDLDLEDPNHQKPGWRNFLSYVGPGFLVSLAYLDPGNLETDLQAGANHRYELLWVILIGLIFALIIQSLAANLGVSTGKHLSELCKTEYPKYVSDWDSFCAEHIVSHPSMGRSSLHWLQHPPTPWPAEIWTCYFGEMSYVKPSATDVLKGMFIPKLSGQGATGDAIALLGALIMPHNLFLHSALVLSRKMPNSVRGINDACRYFLIESGFALFIAFLINLAVISVSGTVCSAQNLSSENADRCGDLTLNSASFLLQNVLGKSSSKIYAIALLASGQSSTITGTYAGQYIMQGFLELKMRKWIRNLVTRCIAIAPSLVVSIIGGSSGAGRLIIIASIIVISWILGLGIIGINIYYLSTGFVGWLIDNNLPKVGNVFIAIIVFPLMAIYILAVIYLTFRKDSVGTFLGPNKNDPQQQANMENGLTKSTEGPEMDRVPYREDLADIALPE